MSSLYLPATIKFLMAMVLVVYSGALPASLSQLDDHFLAARKAFQEGKAALVHEHAQRLQQHVLAPYIEYYQLRMYLRTADITTIEAFLTRHENHLLADRLRADWLKMLANNHQWQLFEHEFQKLIDKKTELLCLAYQYRIEKQDQAAIDSARALWFTANSMPDSCTPVFNTLISRNIITVNDRWARIRLALEAGQTGMARYINRRIPEGEALNVDELNAAAQNPLHYLKTRQNKISTRADREIALFALLRLLTSDTNPALVKWYQIKDKLTASDQSYFLGRLGYRAAMRHDPRALNWFHDAQRIKDTYPMTDTLLAWQVRVALRAENWDSVLDGINRMSAAEQADSTWQYWKARALKAKGKSTEANTLLIPLSNQHHYYGQLAKEELGTVLGTPQKSVQVGEAEVIAMEKTPGIQRTLAFYRMNLRTEAYWEWVWTIRDFNDRQLLAAAEVARRHGHHDRAINTASKTTDLHDFRLRFPTPHREVLRHILQDQDLDEAWVYGLIRQESRFLSEVRSSAGAIGLMQLMPDTAKWVAKQLGMANFQQNLITQIDTNLRLGTYYLKYVLATLDNQPLLASAAYNAGPGRAKRWRDTERSLEGAIYAETIPFSETRDYVKKVLKNSVYYSTVLEQDRTPPTLKERLGIVAKK
ncbi:lytic transglycosylase domain-containing protein [Nitrosomonas marina]|uniref:Soluble lytic murein transglycosylase n=1 Tax=Nitrosomonas marina TaxID=917 RepID=A0A1H8HKL5_9PROT|nr:lytic transglycosylase domain-containing protein [Nitrosomonas marina]SEN56752.1 soluble lytic murein transglycosylase [Nitrosomonas marina]